MRTFLPICATAALLLGGASTFAADSGSGLSLGLSYLATSGNSSSQTGGIDVAYKQSFAPWGFEAYGNYLRAEQDGVLTAKKLLVGARGTRELLTDVDLFVAGSVLNDEFAGLDSRVIGAAGATYKYLNGPEHDLAFDVGVTVTRDDLVAGKTETYPGGLAAARYAWTISKTAKLTEDLSFLPSFEETKDWRIESKAGLQAAVSANVAIKLTYALRYANRPVPGFRKTDTQTAVSLVMTVL